MKSLITRLFFSALVLTGASACVAQTGTEDRTVLTSVAPVYQLALALLQDTGVTVVNVPERPRSMSSQPTFFLRQSDDLHDTFAAADAAIGISRVWNQDPLYLFSREANIRIVNIDAALPWSHERSGVALVESPVSGDHSLYFWTAISNVIRMNEIVGFDLKALFPDEASTIDANLQQVKNELIALKAEMESRLLEVPDPLVYALTDELAPMTNELGIYVDGYFVKQDIDWTEEDISALTQKLQTGGIPVVIHKWEPSDEIHAAIEAGGARLVVLDNLELTETPLATGLRANAEALLGGFR